MPMNARAHTQHTHKARTFQSALSEPCLAKRPSDQKFLEKLSLIHLQNDELSKGCCYCGSSCFHALKQDHEGIVQYRQSFSELPKATQDRDLLWIFYGSAEVLPIPEEASPKSSPKGPEKTSSTNSSHEAEAEAKAVEAASSSDTEDAKASSLCQEATSPSSNADNATDTEALERGT